MQVPDNIAHITEATIALKDQYFDLKGLALYSSIGVKTLREYIHRESLPCFLIRGKILIRKTEFDRWIEMYRLNQKQKIESIVNEVMTGLKIN